LISLAVLGLMYVFHWHFFGRGNGNIRYVCRTVLEFPIELSGFCEKLKCQQWVLHHLAYAQCFQNLALIVCAVFSFWPEHKSICYLCVRVWLTTVMHIFRNSVSFHLSFVGCASIVFYWPQHMKVSGFSSLLSAFVVFFISSLKLKGIAYKVNCTEL